MGADARTPPASGSAAGHAALIAVQLVFGLFPVYGFLAMDPERGFSPFGLAVWRIAAGAAVLTLMASLFHRGSFAPRRADLPRLALLALLGIVLNQGLYLTGLARSNATNAGLMMCTIPVFTFLVAALARQERFSRVRGLGVALSLVGVLPLVLGEGIDLSGEYALGNGLMALNCLSYSCYLVLAKPLRTRYPALVLIAWTYLLSLPYTPLFAGFGSVVPVQPGDGAVWGALTFVLLGPTILAYLLNAFALGRVRASTTAVYIYAQPVLAALGGHLVLGETLDSGVLLAAPALFAGIALVSRPR